MVMGLQKMEEVWLKDMWKSCKMGCKGKVNERFIKRKVKGWWNCFENVIQTFFVVKAEETEEVEDIKAKKYLKVCKSIQNH